MVVHLKNQAEFSQQHRLRKFLVIANPGAGSFGFGTIVDKITGFFKQHQVHHEIVYTTRTDDYGLKELGTHYRDLTDILVVGGDGTLGAAVNAFIGMSLPISIVPVGTGNDFVKNLGTTSSLDDALQIALDGKVVESDCGLCNGRYFINGVGIGFDGRVVEYMLKNKSVWKGHLAYLASVVKILAQFRESQLTYSYDHMVQTEKVFLMTIANGTTFGGGFKITPNARIDDGKLDVCLIKPIHPLRRFFKMSLLKNGNHGSMKEVSFFNIEDLKIEASKLLVAHMDGDFIGNPPFRIQVVKSKVLFRIKQPLR